MNRKLILYIGIVVIIAGLLIYDDASSPDPIDWTPTYSTSAKAPLGLYVFNEEVNGLVKGDSIEKFRITPYEYFDEKYDYDTEKYTIKGTFLAISEVDEIDSQSATELLSFADYGNTVVLSMKQFPQKITDTLDLHAESRFFGDSIQFNLQKSPAKKYWYNEGVGVTFFDSLTPQKIKESGIKILGYQIDNGKKLPNFIEVPFGNGRILLHTQPAVFSNYYLLKGNHYQYTQDVVSLIPRGTLYWQDGNATSTMNDSPLGYILKQPALKAAYYLGLLGLAVFIFFNAKRKQRIIPEIAPLRNTTIDFAKTIGNLYFMEGDHHTIIEKKIIYFLEQVRTEYLIDTYSLDDAFAEKLHLKTGKPVEEIQTAINLIKKHRHNFASTEADVAAVNNAIENLRI
ncbi:hypothetical protein Q765_04985 [Flavobacterium rivuli WB 3.3-2 = DSM 21788]|uniref:DUF4350 domain-containing protein n=1 Tax=Flavobacterium rivuli WB 3.3-2 = DSM 21788 TaxID=1121895 RepID=A0A0A2M5B3_9FLAO|nr:DUF4350 domain-containing protein [Flavobacterium rivuli]KGO87842.1 hypothetical protein Q765_04985 [Flavobacterium rivuli WB 3.3-2 = DSM 21788]